MALNRRFSQDFKGTASLTKLMPIWTDHKITLGSMVDLVHSFVTTIVLMPVNGKAWQQSFGKMKKQMPLLNVQYTDNVHRKLLTLLESGPGGKDFSRSALLQRTYEVLKIRREEKELNLYRF